MKNRVAWILDWARTSRCMASLDAKPSRTFLASTSASEQSTRKPSCSLDISSEKNPTERPSRIATCWAMLRAKEVLPTDGRAAMMIRSVPWRPEVIRSSSVNPVARPESIPCRPRASSMISRLWRTTWPIGSKPP